MTSIAKSIIKPQEVKTSINRLISHLQLDSKSILAKLMAQENITIEHSRQATTASFDLNSRRLVLPVWENMSSDEYDMLIGHEVGHALFTCSADSLFSAINRIDHTKPERAKTYLNIIEDVRIERLIQEKYPGLRQNFRRAYDSFWKRGFFQVAGKDLKDLPFIDRVNIHFKMHDPVMYPVPFQDDEKPIVQMIADAQEWADVVRSAEAIYKMYEDRARRKQSEKSVSDSSGQNGPLTLDRNPNPQKNSKKVSGGLGSSSSESSDSDDTNDQVQFDLDLEELDRGGLDDPEETPDDSVDSDSNDDSEAGDQDSKEGGLSSSPQDNDQDANKGKPAPKPSRGNDQSSQPDQKSMSDSSAASDAGPEESVTQKNLDTHIEAEARKGTTVAGEIDYIEIGELKNLDRNIFRFENFWKHNEFMTKRDSPKMFSFSEWSSSGGTLDGSTVPQFSPSAFRNKIRKDVLNLVQEFNLRKAADEYSRATVSRTGVIDPNKLHSFQYNDDIFHRALQVKKGKSHGLVMVIDWSGSMTRIIADVLRQTLVLCEFCRQVQIPFEVYLFTDSLKYVHKADLYSVNPNEVFVPDSPYYPFAKKNTIPDIPPASAAPTDHAQTTDANFDVGSENHLAVGNVTLCQLFKSVMTHQEYEMAFNTISQWYYAHSQEARTCYVSKDGTISTYNEVRKTRDSHNQPRTIPYFQKCSIGFGGTPLDESILCSSSIVLDFKRKTGVQIVNLILLTDGESNSMGRIFHTKKGAKSTTHLGSELGRIVVFRDKVTRYQTVIDYSESVYSGLANLDRVTKGLLHLVRYRTQCNIIGIYLVNSRQVDRYLAKFYPKNAEKIAEEKAKFKEKKYAEVNNAGYTSYFFIPSDCLGDDILGQEDSENESILSPKRTVTRFLKESAEEQHSRVFLGRFMDIVGKEFAGVKEITR